MIEIVKWAAIFIVLVAVLSSPLGPVAIGAVIIIAVIFIVVQRGTSASARVITSIIGGALLLVQYEQYQKKYLHRKAILFIIQLHHQAAGLEGVSMQDKLLLTEHGAEKEQLNTNNISSIKAKISNKAQQHCHFVAGQFVSRAYVVLLRKYIPQRKTYKLPFCLMLGSG